MYVKMVAHSVSVDDRAGIAYVNYLPTFLDDAE